MSGELLDVVCATDSIRAVPKNMQRYGRADSGEQVHLAGVAELFLGRGGGGWLDELTETRAGIRKAPGRQLYAEGIERMKDLLSSVCVHRQPLFQRRLEISPSAASRTVP